MIGSRSVDMVAEVEKVRCRERTGAAAALNNMYRYVLVTERLLTKFPVTLHLKKDWDVRLTTVSVTALSDLKRHDISCIFLFMKIIYF